MRTSKSKELSIYCDPETNTASVRIFKYRNYLWAGGTVMEIKKDSIIFKRMAELVGVETLWDTTSEIAKTYKVKDQ
jgi:hypothetical protein